MSPCQQHREYTWLEILLAISVISLLIQVMPDAWRSGLDFRRWPRAAWFTINLSVLALLVGVRFCPHWIEQRRTKRAKLTLKQATTQSQEEKKKRRETLEQMKAAQKRRIY